MRKKPKKTPTASAFLAACIVGRAERYESQAARESGEAEYPLSRSGMGMPIQAPAAPGATRGSNRLAISVRTARTRAAGPSQFFHFSARGDHDLARPRSSRASPRPGFAHTWQGRRAWQGVGLHYTAFLKA